MKSILIKDTTREERIEIVKNSLDFGDGECEGIDMEDMYDDYIAGKREISEINAAFSKENKGFVLSGQTKESHSCTMY